MEEKKLGCLTVQQTTISAPLLPHMSSEYLSELVTSMKQVKRRASKRSFGPVKGDLSRAYLETVEGQVIEKWLKDAEQLSAWTDFPLIVRSIQVFDETLKIVDLPETLKDNSAKIVGGTEDTELRKIMREILLLFSFQLLEKKELMDIEKKFMVTLSPDPSVHLKTFFEKHISRESKLLGMLKALNQAILAPSFTSLRDKFNTIGMPIVEVDGAWLIEVVFQSEDVYVIHSKRARSTSGDPEEEFSFRWHLVIVIEKRMFAVKQAKMSIAELEMNKQMKEKTKKKLQNIKDHELVL